MMKPSIECLHDEEVGRLLTGEVDAARTSELEQHLANCIDCRQRLEHQVGDDGWWNETESSLRSQHVAASLRDADEGVASLGETRLRESVLDLLGPTDDPNMLGRIGPYEIIGLLGQGGMGAVFKGFDRSLNRFVAIKMLLPHLAASGAARKRFAREGQAVAAVVDDHVMAIHCVDEWQGVPYLVMTYSRGVSLQKRLSDNGPLEVREILRIGMQVAKGLAAAHAQGIVHRDIKPANIFLDQNVERVQLMDFGLARAVDDASLTRSGTLAGTPQYMSPEQARAETVDHRSDLFSLGSVLYAMCTGHAPFRAESSYSVLRLITDKEPRPIREINPDVPEWLCAIISKLMAKKADERFASAQEVAELLEDCLAHVQQPTSGPLPASRVPYGITGRPSFSYKTRNGVIAMIGLIVLMFLGGGLLQQVSDTGPATDKNENSTPSQLNEKPTGKQLGTVLGKPFYESDLNKNTSTDDNLKRLVLQPLTEEYCQKNGLGRTDELNAKIKDEGQRKAAGMFVFQWELQRHLYEKHGGRVELSAFGSVAFDGMRKWLDEREQAGALEITDLKLKTALKELYNQVPPGTMFAKPDQLETAFDPANVDRFIETFAKIPAGASRDPNRKLIGVVLGNPIYLHQRYLENTHELPGLLKSLLLDPLEKHYRQQHPELEPTEAEFEEALVIFRRNIAAAVRRNPALGKVPSDVDGVPSDTEIATQDALESIARKLTTVRFQRHLFETYGGGRFLLRPSLIAFDAQRKWVEERERLGEFQITDPAIRTLFYDTWTKGAILHGSNLTDDPRRISAIFGRSQSSREEDARPANTTTSTVDANTPTAIDHRNARSVVEAYVAAALAGDVAKAASLANGVQADAKRITEFRTLLNVHRIKIPTVYVNDPAKPTRALATSEAVKLEEEHKQPDGQRDGFLVFTLDLIDEKWLVSDLDLESESGAEEELKQFLKTSPGAIGLSPVSQSPMLPGANSKVMAPSVPAGKVGQTIIVGQAKKMPAAQIFPAEEVAQLIARIKKNEDATSAVIELRRITGLDFGDGDEQQSRRDWQDWWQHERDCIENATGGSRPFIILGAVEDDKGSAIAGVPIWVQVPFKNSATGQYRLAHTISDHKGRYVLAFGLPAIATSEVKSLPATFTVLPPPQYQVPESKPPTTLQIPVTASLPNEPDEQEPNWLRPKTPRTINFLVQPKPQREDQR
jgi:serine/threonine protein kinase